MRRRKQEQIIAEAVKTPSFQLHASLVKYIDKVDLVQMLQITDNYVERIVFIAVLENLRYELFLKRHRE